MRRSRSFLVCALLVVSGVSACGGDGAGSGGSPEASVAIEEMVLADALVVAEAFVADLGSESALTAVGYALDRGYSAAQIVAAAPVHTLRADGTIDGAVPELPAWGLFADLPTMSGLRAGSGDHIPVPAGVDDGQITKDQFTRGLADKFEAYMDGTSGDDLTPNMIGLILGLSDAGYSAEQIILGIALDEWVLGAVPQVPLYCWHLRDANDAVIRPAGPAGDAFIGSASCRRMLDELVEGTDTSSTETPSTEAPPADSPTTVAPSGGGADGIYDGSIDLPSQHAIIYELYENVVQIDVTGDPIRAVIDLTLHYGRRWSDDVAVCTVTVRQVYRGSGAPGTSVEISMAPELQEIIAVEGTGCGTGDGYKTTASEDLEAEWAEVDVLPLVGRFSDRAFSGTFAEVYGVTATD